MAIVVRTEHIDLGNGQDNISNFHLSDLHLRYSTKILKSLETHITISKPDLILITGDYYDIPRGAQSFKKFIISIARNYPIAFVKGNHDRLFGNRVSDLLLNIPNCFSVEIRFVNL